MDKLPKQAIKVLEAGRAFGLELRPREFPEGTRTAEAAARAVDCDVAQIVKSLVFMADGRPVLVLTSGANMVDPDKVARALGATAVRRANADQARDATGYAIGGTPPFGHPERIEVLVDRDLTKLDVVWAAAGTPHHVFPISAGDLLRASGGRVLDVAQDAGAGRTGRSGKAVRAIIVRDEDVDLSGVNLNDVPSTGM